MRELEYTDSALHLNHTVYVEEINEIENAWFWMNFNVGHSPTDTKKYNSNEKLNVSKTNGSFNKDFVQ